MADSARSSVSKPRATSSLPTFTQEFARMIRRYKKYCRYVQRLLEETDKSYNEIYEKRVLTPGKFSSSLMCRTRFLSTEQLAQMKMPPADREYIETLPTRPLALIICSQTYNGKSRFVNELLNESLLPEVPTVNNDDVIRMIRIKVEKSFSVPPQITINYFSIIQLPVSA